MLKVRAPAAQYLSGVVATLYLPCCSGCAPKLNTPCAVMLVAYTLFQAPPDDRYSVAVPPTRVAEPYTVRLIPDVATCTVTIGTTWTSRIELVDGLMNASPANFQRNQVLRVS